MPGSDHMPRGAVQRMIPAIMAIVELEGKIGLGT
ncbi:MAG: hypothetical protein JWN85_2829 [Gammaproteobacteria bacterium]|nr:hypothetical protein [Gammaproteobacteria bacterium]